MSDGAPVPRHLAFLFRLVIKPRMVNIILSNFGDADGSATLL